MNSLATTSSVINIVGLVDFANSLSKTKVSLVDDDPLLSSKL